MKKVFSLLIVCVVAITAAAVPARPGGFVRTAADGTQKTVFLHGDEHFHYLTDAEGNWLDEETLVPLSAEVKQAREKRGMARMQARRIAERRKVGGALNLAPRGLIILVSFSDKDFSTPLATMDEMLNSDDYSRSYSSVTASGSARKYFQDQSWGQYNPVFDVVGPVKLSKKVAYYGKDYTYQGQTYEGYDEHADEMIASACKLADTEYNVDFTQYDNDNDGYVDFVYVIYAGYGQADGGDANTVWPHNSTLIYEGQGITCMVDGKQVNNYACSNEINYSSKQYNGIGTFCHEFSHVLGLPDLYITDGNATHKTMGDWDILDSGPYNNDGNTPPAYSAYERFYCGWFTPRVLTDPEEVTLHLLNDTKEALLISKTDVHNLVGNDPDPTEFYLLENRKKEGWDQYIPGAGMLLTHIRYSVETWENNTVNNAKSTMGVDIVEADGKTPSGSSGNSGYYGKAKDAFPAGATSWTALANHGINDIQLQNDVITFNYRGAFHLNALSNDTAWGTVAGETLYKKEPITVTATPKYGYHFVQWSDGITDNPRVITLTSDSTIIAVFAPNMYSFSATCNSEEGEVNAANGEYPYLTNLTITAKSKYGYHFVQWNDGNTDNPRTIELTKDTTFTAEFAIDTSGSCGKDNKLTWTYDPQTRRLTISGKGSFDENMKCGLAKEIMVELVIEEGVTSIGYQAFSDCTNLTSITIPNSVTSIGEKAFLGCISLPIIDNIRYADTYLIETIDKTLSSYIVKEGTRWIGNYAFKGCSCLTSITIPTSVTSIGSEAFRACSSLTSVAIPNSITSIGKSAFSHCTGLISVTIGNSLKCIEETTFNDCTSLTSITIPNSVTTIGTYAFSGCAGLTSVTIGNSVTRIGVFAFNGCTGLTSITIPNSVKTICRCAFYSCTGLTSMTIGNNVTSIEESTFKGCSSLTSINIPNSVTSIGESVFSGCSSLPVINNIRYADTYLVSIVDNSVSACMIKNGTKWIGDNAFSGCTALTSVAIPNSVKSIGSYAFRNCTSLKIIYSMPIIPPSLENGSKTNPFKIHSDAIVYVPNESVSAYKSTKYWKDMTIQPALSSKSNAAPTSVSIMVNNILWELNNDYIASIGIKDGETYSGNILEYIGLEPNSEYKDVPVVLTSNAGETETVKVSFSTTPLELTTQVSVPVSEKVAILLAETNMADIETSCGFEWKRNDMPDDYVGNKVFCPVANGTIAGRLKNLKDDVLYKYRAFYQSAAGNMYYGDWQYIFTGDVAVEFDPILYTYAAALIKEHEATLKGYALAGSTDFTEQGFEYWAESRAPLPNAPRRLKSALGERHTVTATGISMRVSLSDLDPGTTYRYRTYAKIGDQVLYGSEMTFTTQGEFTYAIKFVNWDGEELQTLHVAENAVPEYTGETPVRPDDEQFTYTFSGWTPEISAATADATYTATFKATEINLEAIDQITNDQSPITNKVIHNGQLLILRGDNTYTVDGRLVR